MRVKRSMIRTAAVVPLVLASATASAHLASNDAGMPIERTAGAAPGSGVDLAGASPSAVTADDAAGPSVSVATPAVTGPASEGGVTTIIGTRPAAGEIPAIALAAYQRAESLIGSVDRQCHLTWQLVAAIGRVESDHGRFDGSSLGEDGVASPAIIGPVLDGSHATSLVRDTDAGLLDGDARFDRAVGPLQFIPSTWGSVGVDGDGDGTRDPQDIDDAALGAAVYLCSGEEDLATQRGARAAVYRYNHSDSYVEVVLAIRDDYLSSATTSTGLPTTTVQAGALVPTGPVAMGPLPTTDDDAAVPGASPGPGPRAEAVIEQGPRGHGGQHGQHGQHGGTAGHGHGDEWSEPAMPTDPTDPTEPTEPTEPTDPAEPTEPPVPSEPTDEPTRRAHG